MGEVYYIVIGWYLHDWVWGGIETASEGLVKVRFEPDHRRIGIVSRIVFKALAFWICVRIRNAENSCSSGP